MDTRSPGFMLSKYQLAPSKDRGQNFLDDPNVIRKVVDSVGAGPDDAVVEVGPGFGALTFGLAERAGHVIAVELDSGIVRAFAEEYGEVERLTLVAGDILEFDFAEASRTHRALGARVGGAAQADAAEGAVRKLLVAGNIPYNVTSPLIARLVETREHVSKAVLMVQAEVGDRLTAGPGSSDYGRLSVVVQFHAAVRQLFTIRRTCFTPRPKVDSRVIEIDFSAAPERRAEAGEFEELVAAAFGKRRKMLRRALSDLLVARGVTAEGLETASGIDMMRRGETLSVEEFERLALAAHGGGS